MSWWEYIIIGLGALLGVSVMIFAAYRISLKERDKNA